MKSKHNSILTVLPSLALVLLVTLGAGFRAFAENPPVSEKALSNPKNPQGAAPTVWQAKQRGAHQTEWEVIRSVPAGNGVIRTMTNKVVELATGLNVRDANGNYQPASAAFTLTQQGAEANNAAHRVLVRPAISEALQIEKDGVTLNCHPICISYFDPADGRDYLLAEITNNAVGYLVSPQTIIFSNCFNGIRASIRYHNDKACIQQDLILEEKPGITPEALGFSPYTRLELWSDWGTNTPAIEQSFNYLHQEKNPAVRQAMLEPDVVDTTLVFSGKLRMGSGKAFSLGSRSIPGRRREDIPVSKTWQVISGENVLIEGVSYLRALPLMHNLPVSKNTKILTNAAIYLRSTNLLARSADIPIRSSNAERQRVAVFSGTLERSTTAADKNVRAPVSRTLPPVRVVPPTRAKIQNAILTADARSSDRYKNPAFTMDFELIDAESFTNFVFQRQEYLCSGIAYFWGETVLSGGTIVKFNPWDPDDEETHPYCLILIWNSVKCLTSMYSPAVFTAVGDNTVGSILDESGVPQYYAEALAVSNSTNELQYLRIAYATQAGLHTLGTHLKHSQILNCGIGVMTEGHTMRLENLLMANISDTAIYSDNCAGSGTHLTMDNCYLLTGDYNTDDPSTSFVLTNSIVYNMGDTGAYLTAYDHTEFLDSESYPVFQTVGNGKYYLSNNTYRNSGTTNINSGLAADLRSLTTYPPLLFPVRKVIGNTNVVLSPQAQRDTDIPDLGWHYSPLDFVFGWAWFTNSTIVLTNGVAIGTFCPVDGGSGLLLDGHAVLVSDASPNQMNHIVRFSTVQEQSTTNWGSYVGPSIMTTYLSHPLQRANFRFTDWSILAQETPHFWAYPGGTNFTVDFRDCQFHGGAFLFNEPSVNVTNTLFEQTAVEVDDYDFAINPTFRNCTFDRGSLYLGQSFAGTWTFFDNIFDKTTIGAYGTITNDYNGYLTNYDRIGTGAHDVILTTNAVGWQSSWLGNFYLPTNSAFVDKASFTNSALIGMYHYTTLTNQTKELTNHLDCGFHYVAVTNGISIDTDGDWIPDYREDINGNASVDSGETDWQNAGDWGLRVWITRPKNNSTLP